MHFALPRRPLVPPTPLILLTHFDLTLQSRIMCILESRLAFWKINPPTSVVAAYAEHSASSHAALIPPLPPNGTSCTAAQLGAPRTPLCPMSLGDHHAGFGFPAGRCTRLGRGRRGSEQPGRSHACAALALAQPAQTGVCWPDTLGERHGDHAHAGLSCVVASHAAAFADTSCIADQTAARGTLLCSARHPSVSRAGHCNTTD